MRRFSAIDFFCGSGGASLGARWAGAQIVAAVNHWEIAAITYELNHGIAPYRLSLSNVDPASLPRCDVMLFSPECTNHSLALGRRERDDTSRNTALEVVRFVAACQPRFFVCENVKEFRQWRPDGEKIAPGGIGSSFARWAAALQDAGYVLNRDHADRVGQVMSAADFGAPQARRRLFVVGVCGGPEVSILNPRRPHRAVGECIDWMLPLKPVAGRAKPIAPRTLERIELAHQEFGDEPCLLVYYKSGPQVLSLQRPCRTVTTHDRFALYHRGRMRMLEPAELRRIMGLPETYRLHGTRQQQLVQLGNGVVPQVEQEILEQLVA